jgi:hypothetical protein
MKYSISVDTRNIEPFILYTENKPTDREARKLVKDELMSMISIKVERYRKDDIDMVDCININDTN